MIYLTIHIFLYLAVHRTSYNILFNDQILGVLGTGALHDPIAIVGMAGEFPGAKNIAALWHNLKKGVDAVTNITPTEYENRGINPSLWQDENWVPAAYPIANADLFDGAFFGISPREARVMDPQHRRFMQCAWNAMEVAGYAPRSGSPQRTAVYAAAGLCRLHSPEVFYSIVQC